MQKTKGCSIASWVASLSSTRLYHATWHGLAAGWLRVDRPDASTEAGRSKYTGFPMDWVLSSFWNIAIDRDLPGPRRLLLFPCLHLALPHTWPM